MEIRIDRCNQDMSPLIVEGDLRRRDMGSSGESARAWGLAVCVGNASRAFTLAQMLALSQEFKARFSEAPFGCPRDGHGQGPGQGPSQGPSHSHGPGHSDRGMAQLRCG